MLVQEFELQLVRPPVAVRVPPNVFMLRCRRITLTPKRPAFPCANSATSDSYCCETATVFAKSRSLPATARIWIRALRLKAASSAACWEWLRPESAFRWYRRWPSTATPAAAMCASPMQKRCAASPPFASRAGHSATCSRRFWSIWRKDLAPALSLPGLERHGVRQLRDYSDGPYAALSGLATRYRRKSTTAWYANRNPS
jgi:hypothetical protein